MSPFETYCKYLCIKNHFCRPKYNYFKYDGRSNAKIEAFNKRKDRYWYEKMSRKYSDQEILEIFVSNFALSYNPQTLWIGEIINSGEKTYKEWLKRKQSLSYLFKEQSRNLFSSEDIEKAFDCSKGHPLVLKKYLSGELYIETLVIYEQIFSFAQDFDLKFKDPVWETVSLKIRKYMPFINTDVSQYKKHLREILDE